MIINLSTIFGGGGGGSYVLPTATASRLGGVKIGSGINVASDGTISANGGGKTVVNFDTTTQAERATLYTTLKALYDGGSGNTINDTYAFYKTINSNQGVPFDYYQFDSANTLILGAVVTSGSSTAYEQVLKIASDGSVTVSTNTVGGGSSPVYNLSTMTQSERAALNASLLAASETERIGANVYIEEARCNYDRVESNKIRFICDFINSDNGYPVQISYIFWLLSDGSYEWDSSSNGNHFALPATYYADYTDTAHTLYTGTTAFWGAGRALGDGVEINVVLLDGPKSGYSVQNLCTSKSAYIERTGDWTGIIGATFEYSGETINAKWSYDENTATLISWNTGGGAAGPTVINLDSLSQSELVDLYNTLSGTTSADPINSNYVFLKAFENGDYGPYRLQMTGMPWGNRVRFACVITDPWNNNNICYLNAELQSDGSLSGNKSNFAVSLDTLKVLRDQAWTKYDFTTSAATCAGGATVATGDTCSGPWAFEIVNTKHYADGEFDNNINNMAPLFAFRITDTDSSDKRYSNPILHYDTITTVVLNDSDGNPHNFDYKFYFDYGDFVVTLLANMDEYRYARFTVTKR